MFSIGHFVESNKDSVDKLVAQQPVSSEMDNISRSFRQIENDCAGNEQLQEYLEELRKYCYQYTEVVLQFNQLFTDNANGKLSEEDYESGYASIDAARSRVHNATIDAFNILSRLMVKNGKNNDWIKPLAQGGRIAYGDFAIKKTVADIIEFNKKNNEHNGSTINE
ncbi:MAG: hypothetical protein Athens071426_523 [Parcubacteria group bacterium Athens0714_26]|nr:MAG: hypothetical protein Athens071426_523 [Parcubacteria group bacterium Athens0714_26]